MCLCFRVPVLNCSLRQWNNNFYWIFFVFRLFRCCIVDNCRSVPTEFAVVHERMPCFPCLIICVLSFEFKMYTSLLFSAFFYLYVVLYYNITCSIFCSVPFHSIHYYDYCIWIIKKGSKKKNVVRSEKSIQKFFVSCTPYLRVHVYCTAAWWWIHTVLPVSADISFLSRHFIPSIVCVRYLWWLCGVWLQTLTNVAERAVRR